jgi:3-deoxy-D-manno-octulosonic-acid transferase
MVDAVARVVRMRWILGLAIYRVLLPLFFLAAFPGWVVKMLRRGGLGSGLPERLGIFCWPDDGEPCGAVHVHAVSVGEALLGLRLIREWRVADPGARFVLATGTATGHAVARAAGIDGLRVTYAPLDFRGAVRRYLRRFEPAMVVLVEAEVWPHLVLACSRRSIPVHLVNARLSPRSARRFAMLAGWVRPMFSKLGGVCVQEAGDARIWETLGLPPERIHHTGSLKFDPAGGTPPAKRPEFSRMIDACGGGRQVVLAASTHAGEEAWIARGIRNAAAGVLPVIVPRHAERREEVADDLRAAGFVPLLRSGFHPPQPGDGDVVLVIDTTGELRDWTAHADVVVIGKSFLARGGQNPCEAIIAGKPVVFGPHMENFQPLATSLVGRHGALAATGQAALSEAVRRALDPAAAARLTAAATAVLAVHAGATRRTVCHLRTHTPS